jgi:lipopolysaccharide/colanic/teichoic acid biosynthesis glycosyltransferase
VKMMSEHRIRVLYVVTAPISALKLLRGQLAFIARQRDVQLVTSPGPEVETVTKREGVGAYLEPMAREISLLQDIRSLVGLYFKFRAIKPQISNVSTPKAGLLGGLAAVFTRVPARVYTLRGLRLETSSGFKRQLLWWVEWLACQCAHKVVCVSPSLQQTVIKMRLTDALKTLVLGAGSSNGVNADQFHANPERLERAKILRSDLGIAAKAPVVGFVGRFTKDKGIEELVNAFDLLKIKISDAILLLLGDFEEGDPVNLETQARIKAGQGIVWAGFVNNPADYYHVFDVFALPTYREGFPNVPLEAAAAGKPVIATNATGARDAVLDGVTGFIVPVGNAPALADALIRVLGSSELAQKLGEAGREWVTTEFQPERIWSALDNLYSSLLEERLEMRRTRMLEFKSVFDFVVALIALIVLSPVLAVLAVLVRWKLGAPIFFSQERPGLLGKPFKMFKFRSMRDARDFNGNLLSDAERLTPFGRLLRSTSLDELPELWNVLTGEMSLVGPRPLLMEYLGLYSSLQARRHEVKPGITGWAQVNGRNAISWTEKFNLDVWYVDHWTFWLDLKILAMTVLKVVRRDDVNAQGSATIEKFSGNVLQPSQELTQSND